MGLRLTGKPAHQKLHSDTGSFRRDSPYRVDTVFPPMAFNVSSSKIQESKLSNKI